MRKYLIALCAVCAAGAVNAATFDKNDGSVCADMAAFARALQDEGICSAKQLGAGGTFAGDTFNADKSDGDICANAAAFVKTLQDEGICSAKQLGL